MAKFQGKEFPGGNEKPRRGAGAGAEEIGSRNLPSQFLDHFRDVAKMMRRCNPRALTGVGKSGRFNDFHDWPADLDIDHACPN